MAKKIQHSDIIQPGNPAIDTIKGLEQLDKGIKELIGTLNRLKTELPKSFKGSADVQKMATAQRDAASATSKQAAAQREAQKAALQLERQRQKGLAAMAKEEQKHREMITAANGEARSLDQLQKKVTALIALRRQLDLSTDGGRRAEQQYTEQIRRSQDTLKRYDAAIGNHQRNVGNYRSALAGVRALMLQMTAVITGVVMVMRTHSRLTSDAINKADIQARSEAKLLRAMQGRTAATAALIRQAGQLQRTTLFGDEATIEAAAQLAVMIGDNEAAISSLLPLVQDMATALNMDLVTAAKFVGKTLGSSTNSMNRFGIEVTGAAGSSERLASIVAALTDKFGRQAEVAAGVGAGSITQLKQAWDDLKEVMGSVLLESTGFASALTDMLSDMATVLKSDLIPGWEKLAIITNPKGLKVRAALLDAQAEAEEIMAAKVGVSVEAYRNKKQASNELIAAQKNLKQAEAALGAIQADSDRNMFRRWENKVMLAVAEAKYAKQVNAVAEAERNRDAALKAYAKSQEEVGKQSKSSLTPAMIELINKYNEAEDAALDLSEASYKIALKWQKNLPKAKNEIEKIREAISKLETSLNLAILTGQPFQKFVDDLVPKRQQIDRMEALAKLFTDLRMGVDLFKDVTSEWQDLGIVLDLSFDEESAKIAAEDAMEIMTGLSDQLAKGLLPKTLLEQMGLTQKDVDELRGAVKTVLGEFDKLFAARRKQADEALALAQQQTSQTIALLQLEYDKRAQGLANNTDLLEETLRKQQKSQEAALAMQQKIAAQQLRVQQAETAGAMIAAVANTYKEWSKLGILGQIGAVVSIAAMMSGFASYQQQIKSMKFERGGRFEEGDRGVIQGDRHTAPSGGVPLSEQIKAERGEKVYVLSRKHSQGKAGKVMDTVFDKIQAGDHDLLSNVTRLITPRITINAGGADRSFDKLVKETKHTNAMLSRWRFYNPVTGVETDLNGNKKIYN
jgi:hypothetical protein